MYSRQFPQVHTGAILAGGRSRRMGRLKEGVLLWDGRPMIDHVLSTLAVVCRQVVVVGTCHGYPIEAGRGIFHLSDRYPGTGPLAGVEALLSSGLDDGYLIVACDQPLLTSRLLGRLLDGAPSIPRFFPPRDGEAFNPFPGYFPASMFPHVRNALHRGDRSVKAVVKSCRIRWVPIPDIQRVRLKSMNTPADLAEMHDARLTFDA